MIIPPNWTAFHPWSAWHGSMISQHPMLKSCMASNKTKYFDVRQWIMLMPNKGITIYCIWHAEGALKLCKGSRLLLKMLKFFSKNWSMIIRLLSLTTLLFRQGGVCSLTITVSIISCKSPVEEAKKLPMQCYHIHAQAGQNGDTMQNPQLDLGWLYHHLIHHLLSHHWKKKIYEFFLSEIKM